ncbi:CRE-SCL-23 protein [Caenorhabditis remanei]|uniref:CRE-SCL-23 protein n=1 Tax=Caenorhabditis remanei TaxID=31234 RepID=E3M6X7_CAERE|nr:CRE-SCL-23 protein [Caenorhabditis remanei]
MQIAETAAIERRTVGSEGSMNGPETNEYNKIELEDEQEVGVKETNKENGRNKENNAGTSSSDSKAGYLSFKGIFIAATVIILSYNILSVTNPRPSRYSVITKMAPQHCGLNLPARIQNLILDKHNEIRSKVALGQYSVDDDYLPPAANMPKLIWDCQLELEAQNRANECLLGQEKINEKMSGLEEVRGENAFYFRTDPFNSSDGVLRGIERMGDEIAIAGIKNLKLARYDKRIGHATQIIWGETRKLGCSIQECAARKDGSLDGQKFNVAVCKYYPTGNVFKSSTPTSIYTVGDVGSSCSEGTFIDPTSGLCVEATWHEKTEEQ